MIENQNCVPTRFYIYDNWRFELLKIYELQSRDRFV